MKVGDLVSYYNYASVKKSVVILYVNEDGGTVKALLPSGEIGWIVKSGCEVISASR